MKKSKFAFGQCSVPVGKSGPWEISNFTVDRDAAMMFNIGNARNPSQWIEPGRYKRLSHANRGVVMSNTPMEIRTNVEAYHAAHGRVLVNGLGMGMLLEGILSKPSVAYVRVIEIDEHIIQLVGPTYDRDPRVKIVQANALSYHPKQGETFDYVWHDIWDSIGSDNLPDMARLGRRYNKRVASRQGFWARDIIRDDQRRGR